MRGLAAALMLAAGPVFGADITAARYDAPTTRYDHGILGDAVEYGALVVTLADGRARRFVLPESRVFEDIAPRLADVDGDGEAEVIAVETHLERGARLSVYGSEGLESSSEFIGQTHRWLAPVGAADLDGDGTVEIAWVDRPHLARVLRVFRWRPGELALAGEMAGVTNHRIGETDIAGGIRDCGQGPEMVVASGDWGRVLAVRFDGRGFARADLGPHQGRGSFAEAMACRR